jgi:hypothetical protein
MQSACLKGNEQSLETDSCINREIQKEKEKLSVAQR